MGIENGRPTRPLRIWPGVAILGLQCVSWFVVRPHVEGAALAGALGGAAGWLLILLWWLLLSRAPWVDRVGTILLMLAALFATRPFLHESIATAGMGSGYYFNALVTMSITFVVAVVVVRRLAAGPRRAVLAAAIVVGCGMWTLTRTGGVIGYGAELRWRWSPSAEERLLAQAGDEAMVRAPLPREAIPAEWPGFRGPRRDGIVTGVRIGTDWSASPPQELWRRPVGPAWSSFAVQGDLIYTQEQRGEEEVVSCYRAATGEPVWMHGDAARFWESNAGAGPRATPALHDGRVYTLGATGIVNALDAADGTVIWSRDLSADTEVKVPYWGFAASPLVVDDLVVAAAAGRLIAYDLATGEPRWLGPRGGDGYSSPHRAILAGVEQILLMSGAGATGVAPADGELLWRHEWGGGIAQPGLPRGGDVLITSLGLNGGLGMRRIAVDRGPGGWTTRERWTSTGLKPYFNGYVVHKGHAYGVDGRILSCIELEGGERRWKGGRYGHGQLVLLAEQDLLVVISEHGELGLVKAMPGSFSELARFQAIEGKTWNNPVVVADLLLVRNDEEMAAFRLPRAGV